jgi:hypothetical protein
MKSVTGSNSDAAESQEEILVQRDVVSSLVRLAVTLARADRFHVVDGHIQPSPATISRPISSAIP